MNNTMEYKGYVGSVEFSEEDGLFYGKVMGIRALISYEGSTAAELVNDFHGAVDDYLALCEEKHTEPERAYKGELQCPHFPGIAQAGGHFCNGPQYESEQSGGKFH